MKTYKPTTPSRRNMVTIDYRKILTTDTPHKALTKGGKKQPWTNNSSSSRWWKQEIV